MCPRFCSPWERLKSVSYQLFRLSYLPGQRLSACTCAGEESVLCFAIHSTCQFAADLFLQVILGQK